VERRGPRDGLGARLATGGLAIAALGLAWLLARALPPGVPFDDAAEARLKAVLCGVALVALLVLPLPVLRRRPRAAAALLAALAAVAAAAWFDFGGFHGGGYVHHWEQFHHHLGARYFPELGYDGLYAASIAAQRETAPGLPVQPWIRDLRTDEVQPTYALDPFVRETAARFAPARWSAFVADHARYLAAVRPAYLADMRADHGLNASPAWIALARLASGWLPTGSGSLLPLALLDPLLLALAFALVFRTRGLRSGCLCVLLFGLGYAGRFFWVGGAFLRHDWLAAVIAAAALADRRPRAAGALLGAAACLRIFPVLLLFGPAVLAARALLLGERPVWARELGLGFALAVAAGLAAGCLAGRGPAAWPEFAREIRGHAGRWLTNDVGLENLVLYDRAIVERRFVHPGLPEPWIQAQSVIEERRAERQVLLAALRLAFLGLLAAAGWRATPAESVVLGMVAVFTLTAPTCYYWSLLALLPLQRRLFPVQGAVALSGALYLVHLRFEAFEMRYGLLSLGLALLFLAWILPDALRAVRPALRAAGPDPAPSPDPGAPKLAPLPSRRP
jgi:hypothetical protein